MTKCLESEVVKQLFGFFSEFNEFVNEIDLLSSGECENLLTIGIVFPWVGNCYVIYFNNHINHHYHDDDDVTRTPENERKI